MMKTSATILCALLLLGGCGEEPAEKAPPPTLAVEKPHLVVEVDRDPLPVQEALEAWARRENADVVVRRGRGDGPADVAETDGPTGTPWLGEPHGLLVRGAAPASWAALAARAAALGLPQEARGLHRIWLGLRRSQGASLVDSTGTLGRLDDGPGVEALAFLVQLSQKARRGSDDDLAAAFAAGEISLLPCGLGRAQTLVAEGVRLLPWPPAENGTAAGLLEVRRLEVPARTHHEALAADLVAFLAGPDAASRIAVADTARVPLHPQAAWELGLLPTGLDPFAPVPAVVAWPAVAAALDEACLQALELRRTPVAALQEAETRREG
jgi:hypothetical protein